MSADHFTWQPVDPPRRGWSGLWAARAELRSSATGRVLETAEFEDRSAVRALHIRDQFIRAKREGRDPA